MAVRLKDIARQLNISESTVSRALSNHPRISDSTKKKVADLVKKLNYHPNLIAKSLKLKKTKTIGLIIGDITNPFYPEIVKGAEDIASRNDLNIILCNSDYNTEKELEYLNVLVGKRVDGILIMPAGKKLASILFLNENDISFVLIDTKPSIKIKTNCVYADQEYGANIATKHLINLGHSKIALINGPKTVSPCRQVENGFIKAMKKSHINIDNKYLKECDLKTSGGYKSMRELLKLKKNELPTAILFISDITAIGAYDAIYEEGLKIPDDFSIVGNDDIPEAKHFSPPLTTIAQPKYELGSKGINLLISELNNKENWSYKQTRLLPKLIIRKSTAPPT